VFARRLLTSVLTITVVAACRSSTETGPQAAHVIVTPDTVIIPQKGGAPLAVVVTDKDDQLISGAVVTFTSSNTQILTVTNLGVIRSVGPAGKADIIVKSGKASTAVPVTVSQVASDITVTPDPATLAQKATLQLHAEVVDAVDTPIPGATITYATNGFGIISVSPTGLITSLGPATTNGPVSIFLSAPGLAHTVSVTVTQVASDLIVTPSTLRVARSGKAQLVATLVDAVGNPMSGGMTTFTSSDQSVVTVSATGLVTSVGPLGTATITVKNGSYTKTVAVEVADISRPSGTSVTSTPWSWAWGIGISPTGVIIAPGIDGQHTGIVDASLGSIIAATGGGGYDVSFTSNGATAYLSNYSASRIDIYDVATSTVTGSFPTIGSPLALQVSRDNQTLYVGGGGLIVAYDLTTKAEKLRIPVQGTVNAIAIHPTLDLIYATGYDAGTVSEINTQTNTVTRAFHVGGTAQEAVVSANGSTLYVPTEGGDLAIFDLSSGTQQQSIPNGGGFGAALTPDGLQLWVVTGNQLKMVDLATRGVQTVSVPGNARRIVFSSDHSTAIVTLESSALAFIR